MIAKASSICALVIHKGGANLILSPWVGLANKPFCIMVIHKSQAASGLACLIWIAFNKPFPLTISILGYGYFDDKKQKNIFAKIISYFKGNQV